MRLFTFVVLSSAFLLVAGNAVPAFADETAGNETIQIQPRQGGEDDPEPTDPSDPTEPTEPEEPSVPTDPTEPTNPEDPEEPSEPTDPSDPTPPSFGLSGSASVNIHPKQSGEDDPEPSKPAGTNPIENPVPTDTGMVIVAVEDSKPIIQSADGTTKKVEAKEIGATFQKDGTLTVKDNDGKLKVLPKTGDEQTIMLPILGSLMSLSSAVFLKKCRKD